MTNYKLALDLEGVLADIHSVVAEESDEIDFEDFETWDVSGQIGLFHDEADKAWSENWEDIPTVEDNLSEKVRGLEERFGEVHILTGRVGNDKNIKRWLDMHGILDIVKTVESTDDGKTGYDFDYFLDDNPNLPSQVDTVILRRRYWNEDLDYNRVINRINEAAPDG